MSRTVLIQPTAKVVFDRLARSDPVRHRKVGLCLYRVGEDPNYPSLRSKRFKSLDNVHGQPIWQSYVENNTLPLRMRVFWHFGPGEDEITVVGQSRHIRSSG